MLGRTSGNDEGSEGTGQGRMGSIFSISQSIKHSSVSSSTNVSPVTDDTPFHLLWGSGSLAGIGSGSGSIAGISSLSAVGSGL